MQITINSFDDVIELQAAKLALDYLIDNHESIPMIAVEQVDSPVVASAEVSTNDSPGGHVELYGSPEQAQNIGGLTDAGDPVAPPEQVDAVAPSEQAIAVAPSEQADVDDVPPEPDVEVDSAGVPYDARIHSGGKDRKNKAGTWKRRRNVSDADYDRILAEITGTPPAAEVFGGGASTPEQPAADAVTPQPTANLDFGVVMQKLMNARLNEQVTQEQIDNKCVELGCSGGFASLGANPSLWEPLLIELGL